MKKLITLIFFINLIVYADTYHLIFSSVLEYNQQLKVHKYSPSGDYLGYDVFTGSSAITGSFIDGKRTVYAQLGGWNGWVPQIKISLPSDYDTYSTGPTIEIGVKYEDGLVNSDGSDIVDDTDGDGIPDDEDTDDDGDGLPDDEDPYPQNRDGDGDGYEDGVEVLYGSDPTDPNSYPEDDPFTSGTDESDPDTITNPDEPLPPINEYPSSNITDTVQGNVYVTNLGELENEVSGIREGLSVRLDKNLSDLHQPITSIEQISDDILDELQEQGITADQAVTYLNDIGVTLDDLLEHQQDSSEEHTELLSDIETAVLSLDSVGGTGGTNLFTVTVTNESNEQILSEINSNLQSIVGNQVYESQGSLSETGYAEYVFSEGENTNAFVDVDSRIEKSNALLEFVDDWFGSFFTLNLPDSIGQQTTMTFLMPEGGPGGIKIWPNQLQIDLDQFDGIPIVRQIEEFALHVFGLFVCAHIIKETFV
ncbi:hypothetical protein EGM51_03705 [Verrucomicrobia bacterium S94]|nr:hypothetical protein EGM51_03705 [Verrucomicrobia bacterium S94]